MEKTKNIFCKKIRLDLLKIMLFANKSKEKYNLTLRKVNEVAEIIACRGK